MKRERLERLRAAAEQVIGLRIGIVQAGQGDGMPIESDARTLVPYSQVSDPASFAKGQAPC